MQPNYYAIIPANVRYDKSLPPATRLLYGEITALSNKEGFCFAGNAYFADLYDVDKLTVSRWISRLKERGYIAIISNPATGERRIILQSDPLTKSSTPIDDFVNPPIQKDQPPYTKSSRGVDEKIKHNNTVNTTPNKTKEEAGSDEPPASASLTEPIAVKQSPPKTAVREQVRLTDAELAKLTAAHGPERTDRILDKLNGYKIQNGKTYRSDYGAILNWVLNSVAEDEAKRERNAPTASTRPTVNPAPPPVEAMTYDEMLAESRKQPFTPRTPNGRDTQPIPF